jgi:hypothetical protein
MKILKVKEKGDYEHEMYSKMVRCTERLWDSFLKG